MIGIEARTSMIGRLHASQEKTLRYFLSRGYKTTEHTFFAGFFEIDGEFIAID